MPKDKTRYDVLISIKWALHFNIVYLYTNYLNFGFKITPSKDKKFCPTRIFFDISNLVND